MINRKKKTKKKKKIEKGKYEIDKEVEGGEQDRYFYSFFHTFSVIHMFVSNFGICSPL